MRGRWRVGGSERAARSVDGGGGGGERRWRVATTSGAWLEGETLKLVIVDASRRIWCERSSNDRVIDSNESGHNSRTARPDFTTTIATHTRALAPSLNSTHDPPPGNEQRGDDHESTTLILDRPPRRRRRLVVVIAATASSAPRVAG